MTDVLDHDCSLIHSIEDVIPLYQGNGQSAEKQQIGLETEIFIYRQDPDGTPRIASSLDCARIIESLRERGLKPQLEMVSTIEYASPAFSVTQIAQLNQEIQRAWQGYRSVIREAGFKTYDAAIAPFLTMEWAQNNLVDRDRTRGLVQGMSRFKSPEFLKITLLCTSTQVSLSYATPEDLHTILTTGYALTGAILGIFANYPPYIEGDPQRRLTNHPRAVFYDAFGNDGGIPQSLLDSTCGEDFIRRHAEQVFRTTMLYFYDQRQTLAWPERPMKFEDLRQIGLNTRSNYDLAESFVYNDLKICNICDSEARPIGKRVEIRGFDAGELGARAAVPFCHALLRDPVGHGSVQALLADYGLLPDQDAWQKRLRAARRSSAYHGAKYLDVPFGVRPDGQAGNLKDFARDLGALLKSYRSRNPDLAAVLADVIQICETGVTKAELKSNQSRDYNELIKKL